MAHLLRQKAAKAAEAKDVRRRRTEAWMIAVAAFVIAVACVFVSASATNKRIDRCG
jgi:hypothetical protein